MSSLLFFLLESCAGAIGAISVSILSAGRAVKDRTLSAAPREHLVGPHASLAYRVPADRPGNPPVKVIDPFAHDMFPDIDSFAHDMFPPIDYEPLNADPGKLLRDVAHLRRLHDALAAEVARLRLPGSNLRPEEAVRLRLPGSNLRPERTDNHQLHQLHPLSRPPEVGALYEDRSFASDHVFTDEEMNLPAVNGRITSENERRKILVRQLRGDAVLYCLVYAEDAFLPRATTKNISSIVSVFNHMYVRSRTEK